MCDSIPGLPSDILFDPLTQDNLHFIELSSEEVWQQAPEAVNDRLPILAPPPDNHADKSRRSL
jgi:hypothetical protein